MGEKGMIEWDKIPEPYRTALQEEWHRATLDMLRSGCGIIVRTAEGDRHISREEFFEWMSGERQTDEKA